MKTHEHNHDPLTNLLRETIAGEPLPPADPSLREALLKRLDQPPVQPALSAAAASRRRTFFQRAGIALASTAALAIVGVFWQRPDLPIIGLAENAPQAVGSAPNPFDDDDKSFSFGLTPVDPVPAGTAPLGESRESLDKLATADPAHHPFSLESDVVASHDRRVRDGRFGESAGGNEVFESQPAGRPLGDISGSGKMTSGPFDHSQTGPAAESAPQPSYTTRGPRDYFAPGTQASASGIRQPAGGSGEGKPVSGRTSGGSDLAPASKSPDNSGRSGPKLAEPTSAPEAATQPLAMSVTPRILVQNETAEGLVLETESKPGNGQGLPAGLAPGQQASDRFYKESGIKGPKPIEDLATVDKSEPLSQLAVKDAQAREAEVRQKVDRVVALTDELNRSKRLSARVEGEQTKLAELEKAIKEVREVESKFRYVPQPGGEQYARIVENQFLHPNSVEEALSTFSIDVDTASYANVRRFLNNGQLPPPDAVRLEELVNYFKYKYPQPKGDDPFSVNLEMADCPWHPGHKLLRVGLQGKEIHRAERPASNLVFLIDTSGSMTDENKLPLLKTAFTMLVGELGENDKVTIVTYAGNAGLRLPPTRGHEKETIIAAIDGMQSGGSTHGSAGISLAYEIAAAQFIKGGTNKVILATDGDLNVGITDDAALVELITKKAETGVYLTVLGVGTGNLKDAKMERLADNGNGIYAYLDSVREARKVLVEEMSGSLVTIAKDVKIQVEFNPAEVQSYRLLGYENRIMAHQDFRNDAKDAGEIGAGHSVTALYEVVLVGADVSAAKSETAASKPLVESLKYQRAPVAEKPALEQTKEAKSGELLTVRLRYKKPEATKEDAAKELEFPLKDKGGNFNSASQDFQFASAVVAFGLSLRNSEFRGGANLSAVSEIATAGIGEDPNGHRAEFLDLVRRAKTLRGE